MQLPEIAVLRFKAGFFITMTLTVLRDNLSMHGHMVNFTWSKRKQNSLDTIQQYIKKFTIVNYLRQMYVSMDELQVHG